jgi:hypothetical protein
MFTIREEQFAAFRSANLKHYEDQMFAHLKKYFPKQCDAQSEMATREGIQFGIERAAVYGIVSRCDVCMFIEVMFTFGHDFDRNPKYSWAANILINQTITDPSVKIRELYHMAISKVGEV